MRYQGINRRHFLQGLGCGLALPFLPSLAPRTAGAAVFDGPKYFLAIGTPHGNVPLEDWAPIEAPMNETQLYSGAASDGLDHRLRHGRLSTLTRSNVHAYNPSGTAELSPVLGHFLNPHLDKLTLLGGLDILFNIGHHGGGNLGNYHQMDDSGIRSNLLLPSMPTIDRVIARSPSFYPEGDPFAMRSINFSSDRTISSDGPVGSVSNQPQTGGRDRPSAAEVFDDIFGGMDPGGGEVDPRLSVVDRVLDDYNRVMNSPFGEGSRISNSDRQRLDEFVTGLNDVEQKIGNLGASCEEQIRPDVSTRFAYNEGLHSVLEGKWEIYLDIVVAAFKCGRTRVATLGTNHNGDDFGGNWHTDIAHFGRPDVAMDYTVRSHRFAAESIFAHLLNRLDVSIDGVSDTTYLDNSIMVWNHESGPETHSSTSMPTLVAGSAGGFLETGSFYDYRNLSNDGQVSGYRPDLTHQNRPGVPYNRWLYTILRAMGIPDAEYQTGALASMQGYGDPYVRNRTRNGHTSYSNAVLGDMGEMLTQIVAP